MDLSIILMTVGDSDNDDHRQMWACYWLLTSKDLLGIEKDGLSSQNFSIKL